MNKTEMFLHNFVLENTRMQCSLRDDWVYSID